MLQDLDEIWACKAMYETTLPKKPSEYFMSNCYVGVSFMSNKQALAAVDQGTTDRLLWGSDYPHVEGTWPWSKLSLRKALEGVPADAAERIVGLNAADVFGVDVERLRPITERIGMTLGELMTPLGPDEMPRDEDVKFSFGFRDGVSWS
jgi:hypothetical protein